MCLIISIDTKKKEIEMNLIATLEPVNLKVN